MNVRALARVRAVLLQRTLQSFDYSVLETVLMGAYANISRWSMPASAAHERAMNALAQVGMESMQTRTMTSLSTGEAQRVGFARVLMTQTKWWMLDEPLSNLDIKHQGQAMSIIQAHCKAGGGCVGILHDINHVERWANDVLLMQGGQVKGVGPKADVLTCERVNEIFGVRLERTEHQGRAWWDVR
jgi:iron complex transport system ATP-binding protein